MLSIQRAEERVINIAAPGIIRLNHTHKKHGEAQPTIAHVLVALLVSLNVATRQKAEVLSLDSHIPLPHVKGRIDHFSVDVRGQRLFVAAVENHTLEVIDLKPGQGVHTITDLAEPQGVLRSRNEPFVRGLRLGWCHEGV